MFIKNAFSLTSKALKARTLLFNTNRVLNLQKPTAKFLKLNYLKNLILGNLILDSLTSLGKFLFFIWEFTSMIGLFSFTIAMLCVAYDCSNYVTNFIAMCIPFLPESMLLSSLPFLIDLGLYTPQETWLQFVTSHFFNGINITYDYISLIYNFTYDWLYHIVTIPYYLIYYPMKAISLISSYILGITTWIMGLLTILLGVKLWVLWDVISTEAAQLMININALNPIPAYVMAMLYHVIIRPGALVVTTGSQYFIDYVKLVLPTWNEFNELLTWVVTGRGTMLWNIWNQIGISLAHISIYPIAVFGTIIDPIQIFIWFHFSVLDHLIIRPSLFVGTSLLTSVGRLLRIFT